MIEIRKDVLEAAVSFKHQMRKVGKGFKFAKASNITETYHYRWFASFLDKCYKKGINLESSKEVIRAIVIYAKEHGHLNKGASLLSRNDIFDIACQRIQSDIEDAKDSWEIIEESANFLLSINEPERFLKRKTNRHGQVNLIALRDNNKLPDSLICLSKSCMRAYISLDNKDNMLSLLEYTKLKIKMISKFGIDELRNLLGDEFNG